jgi:thioester reductase-like protein
MSQPSQSVVDLLQRRAELQGEQEAYSFLRLGRPVPTALTYAALHQSACAVGAALSELAPAGERVLLLLPSGLDYVATFFGCLYSGHVAVPAYPPTAGRPDPRIQTLAADAQAAVVVATARALAQLERHLEHYPALRGQSWIDVERLVGGPVDGWQPRLAGPATLAYLQYTSGSTAAPRGVMITHGNILHNVAAGRQAIADRPQTHGVSWAPLFHDMGLVGGVLTPLELGIPVTMLSPLDFLEDPLHWLGTISALRATGSQAPNFAYELCVDRIPAERCVGLDLSTWNVAVNGAEPVRPATLERFTRAFAAYGFRREVFLPTYGIAEATLFVAGGPAPGRTLVRQVAAGALEAGRVVPITAMAPDDQPRLVASCGRIAAGSRVVIVDPETCRRLPPDRVGEIWVASPSVGQGYWGRPAESEPIFRARLADGGADAYLRTGDLGFIDDGELVVTGRIKDLIIIRGRNIYPHDIERTVEASHAELRPGAAVAFAVDSGDEERLVVAAEVERRYWPEPAALEPIVAAIRRAVASEHQVEVAGVALLGSGSLPKTSSGKLQRQAARQAWLGGGFRPLARWELLTARVYAGRGRLDCSATTWTASQLLTELVDRVNRALGADGLAPFSVHDHLLDLGLDSLSLVKLKLDLDDALGRSVPFAPFEDNPSLHALSERLAVQFTVDPPVATGDLPRRVSLDPAIRPTPGLVAQAEPADLLVTGATGYLGAYLMRELLDRTRARLHCLVRAPDENAGWRRIRASLAAHGLWDDDFSARLRPLVGDLARPLLGLGERTFEELAERVDAIYHNGAWLNFVFSYATLAPANVLGTQEVLRLACVGRLKAVHYVSTVGVLHTSAYAGQLVDEQAPLADPAGLALGYLESKWAAERLVRAAGERGLPVAIYRPAWIFGDGPGHGCNPDDFLARMIRGCLQLGCAPVASYDWNIVPVDFVSRAIVHLAGRPESIGQTFHLVAEDAVSWDELVAWITADGRPLDRVPYPAWLARLRADDDNVLASLLPIFAERPAGQALTLPELYQQHEALARPSGRATTDLLASAGIRARPLNRAQMQVYLRFLDPGAAPAARARGA